MLRFLLLVVMLTSIPSCAPAESSVERVTTARLRVESELGYAFGRPVFLRIVKETLLLELWTQHNGRWSILKSYHIAGMSGTLGPKTAEGDCQAPEGFYATRLDLLNPRSRYHLSFNIGYPNAYDRKLGRTGSYIMVHGSDVSIGCFAMTDSGIEEIYTLVHQALLAGQPSVPIQIYPFEMTPERMEREKTSPHYSFWQYLQPGWQHTHTHHEPYTPGHS